MRHGKNLLHTDSRLDLKKQIKNML